MKTSKCMKFSLEDVLLEVAFPLQWTGELVVTRKAESCFDRRLTEIKFQKSFVFQINRFFSVVVCKKLRLTPSCVAHSRRRDVM
jgi:hypothetical protein